MLRGPGLIAYVVVLAAAFFISVRLAVLSYIGTGFAANPTEMLAISIASITACALIIVQILGSRAASLTLSVLGLAGTILLSIIAAIIAFPSPDLQLLFELAVAISAALLSGLRFHEIIRPKHKSMQET